MSTEIHYNFNKEANMSTNPFDDLWDKTHHIPTTKQPVYDEIEVEEDIPDYEVMDDSDEM